MTASALTIPKRLSPFLVHLVVSVVLTTFLFWLDEGYYNFNWTKNLWNWLFFVIYASAMFIGQTITDKYFLKKFKDDSKQVLVGFIGIPLGLAILFTIGFSLKYFFS